MKTFLVEFLFGKSQPSAWISTVIQSRIILANYPLKARARVWNFKWRIPPLLSNINSIISTLAESKEVVLIFVTVSIKYVLYRQHILHCISFYMLLNTITKAITPLTQQFKHKLYITIYRQFTYDHYPWLHTVKHHHNLPR